MFTQGTLSSRKLKRGICSPSIKMMSVKQWRRVSGAVSPPPSLIASLRCLATWICPFMAYCRSMPSLYPMLFTAAVFFYACIRSISGHVSCFFIVLHLLPLNVSSLLCYGHICHCSCICWSICATPWIPFAAVFWTLVCMLFSARLFFWGSLPVYFLSSLPSAASTCPVVVTVG